MGINIKPLADRVIVAPAKVEDKTKSRIIIPDTAKEKPHTGEVVAIGTSKLSVSVGDTVLYSRHSGSDITHKGKDYLMMKEHDILAIIFSSEA